jgi:predicted  nucleic acid-binding Zn-ribbon protein
VETQAERLIVLQDLVELRQEMSDAQEVAQMAEMGFVLRDRDAVLSEIDAAIAALRSEIPPSLLKRFERVAAKYRRPLAPVRNGTCYGCFTRFPTGKLDVEVPDGVPACPNCGRLVYAI